MIRIFVLSELVIVARVECPRVRALPIGEAARSMNESDSAVPLFVPPGDYYSPIVNPQELRAAGFRHPYASGELPGIDLNIDSMMANFLKIARHQDGLEFPEQPNSDSRYGHLNDQYGYGSAHVLAGVIREFRPKRIIEVGSGHSSAVILETLDRTPELRGTSCTFIDPNPGRLESILRPEDHERATIIRKPVQSVPLSTFDQLQSGDILFLDTTHVVKTGSDVVFELFEVLPRLKSGVLIHFHDIFAGFEYLEVWIFDQNRSWNEIYALRAFLMHNNAYEIWFWVEQFHLKNKELVRAKLPQLAQYPDGGLWLRKN